MDGEFFRPGDRWTAIGDSITETGRHMARLEYFVRCGGGSVSFRNAGIGGDATRGAVRRLDRELEVGRPDAVTFLFGMNDVNRGLFTPGADPRVLEREATSCRDVFAQKLGELVTRALKKGLRAAVISPPHFEHHPASSAPDLPGVNEVLEQLSHQAEEIAARQGIPFVDLHGGMLDWTRDLRRFRPDGSLVDGDRVHPTLLGQLVMAVIIHGALAARSPDRRLSPALAAAKEAPMKFSLEPAGLPILWPGDLGAPREFLEKLRERLPVDLLQIRDLPPGRYILEAEGNPCGTFSHTEFHSGLPLDAVENFPTTSLSRKLHELLERKTVLQWEFRMVDWCEFMASEKSPGVSDAGEVVRILRELQIERPYLQVPIEQRLENYSRLKADAAGHLRRIEDVEKEIDALSLPKSISCALQPENGKGKFTGGKAGNGASFVDRRLPPGHTLDQPLA